MTDQTGNERHAGVAPARETQQAQISPIGEMMDQQKQRGTQMDQQTRRDQHEQRRAQAGAQSDQGLGDRGFGYGAQDGEEMKDAPDASERGYGGGGEKREEKIDEDE